ncbi:MAG TPA: hypothetical protein VKU41_22765, partial [Polyangiaceae bacterium]|nr:hypothetical protein [Polyangiaceae bacterium]
MKRAFVGLWLGVLAIAAGCLTGCGSGDSNSGFGDDGGGTSVPDAAHPKDGSSGAHPDSGGAGDATTGEAAAGDDGGGEATTGDDGGEAGTMGDDGGGEAAATDGGAEAATGEAGGDSAGATDATGGTEAGAGDGSAEAGADATGGMDAMVDATTDAGGMDAVATDAPSEAGATDAADAAATHTVGGTLSGLSGTGLVLQNNGGADLSPSSNGKFTFPTRLADGASYDVTVAVQPSGETCTVSNATGTVNGADVTNVTVSCTVNLYTIGGTVTGLPAGTSVTLQDNGGDNLRQASDGTFTFAT